MSSELKWHRGVHSHPCSETDRIDLVLNDLDSRTIILSKDEVDRCVAIGKSISRHSLGRGLRNHRISTESDEFIQIIGVLGEYATCKYLDLPYTSTINTFRRADLPHDIEVKAHMEARYGLRIRPDDAASRKMVMAIVPSIGAPILLPGWILAGEGKRIGKVIDPRNAGKPMSIVDQEHLRPMSELKQIISSENEGF